MADETRYMCLKCGQTCSLKLHGDLTSRSICCNAGAIVVDPVEGIQHSRSAERGQTTKDTRTYMCLACREECGCVVSGSLKVSTCCQSGLVEIVKDDSTESKPVPKPASPWSHKPGDLEPDRLTDPFAWNAWAKEQLSKWEGLYLRETRERAEAQQQAKLLKKEVDRKDAVILAQKEVESLLKRGRIEMLDLGRDVMTLGGKKARISGVHIDRGGVKYWVVWFDLQGRRVEERLDDCEVEPYEEPLMPRFDDATDLKSGDKIHYQDQTHTVE